MLYLAIMFGVITFFCGAFYGTWQTINAFDEALVKCAKNYDVYACKFMPVPVKITEFKETKHDK